MRKAVYRDVSNDNHTLRIPNLLKVSTNMTYSLLQFSCITCSASHYLEMLRHLDLYGEVSHMTFACFRLDEIRNLQYGETAKKMSDLILLSSSPWTGSWLFFLTSTTTLSYYIVRSTKYFQVYAFKNYCMTIGVTSKNSA